MPATAIELLRGEREPTGPSQLSAADVERLRNTSGFGSDPARSMAAMEEAAEIIRAAWPAMGVDMHTKQGTVTLTQVGSHEAPNPLLAVCQLRAADVPDLWCPPGFDVLQVLWCPAGHYAEGGYGPMVELRWRRDADELGEVDAPVSRVDQSRYRPIPCTVNPEQIVEYPDYGGLPPELTDAMGEMLEDTADNEYAHDYDYSLSVAPGWKAGGWPKWNVSGKDPRGCASCGQAVTLLLTIDSSEFDGGTRPRWQVIEDRQPEQSDPEHRAAVREPTGIMVSRWGSLRIFVCTQCPDTPYRWDYQ